MLNKKLPYVSLQRQPGQRPEEKTDWHTAKKQVLINRQKRQRGQSLVEMSFGFIILSVMLFGLIDLGRLYIQWIALQDAAADAALYAAIHPECLTDIQCSPPNNASFRAEMAGGRFLDWQGAIITFREVDAENVAGYQLGDEVHVTVQYPFRLITPLISQMIGSGTITLTGQAAQTIVTAN